MSKIITIIGTRPEFIRLSKIIPRLDESNNNILVHTGQNYNYELDKIFFKELKLRKPDYYLGAKGSFSNQLGIISKKLEKIILKEKPEKFIVLGDTNSSLGAIVAKRLNIKVYHLEAGNRSFLKNSPEEVNRKIIDHISDFNMPYTKRSCENLVREGINRKNIFIIGNPIYEVINNFKHLIFKSKVIEKLNLKNKKFIICTLHRQENVDDKIKLKNYILILEKIANLFNYKIIFSTHPRTIKNLKRFKIKVSNKIHLIKPIGFFDFINLEINSQFVITDSGTVQEEASILKKPCIVFRDATERPETIENGDTIIINKNTNNLNNLKQIIKQDLKSKKIEEYHVENVSQIVANIINSDLEV